MKKGIRFWVVVISVLTLLGIRFDYIAAQTQSEVIIADHTAVDKFDQIPQFWIDEVKKMLFNIPGQSHGQGYMYGLDLLGTSDARFAVNVTWSGEPENYTDQHIRAVRSYRNEYNNWSASAGEQNFWTNDTSRSIMKNHLSYMNDQGNPVSVFGFGWCWDLTWHNGPGGEVDPVYGVHWAGSSEGGPAGDMRWGIDDEDNTLTGNSVNLYTYINTVEEYKQYCIDNNIPTAVIFTTGPVDGYTGESGYQRFLKHQEIRNYVQNNGGILFDYADILCWNENGEQHTTTWDNHTFQIGDPLLATGGTGYDGGRGGCHISEAGCIRLGKAMWWMMARIAGWDGTVTPDLTPASVVQNLTSTRISDTQIDLSWNASSDPDTGVSYYKIYRNGVEIYQTSELTYSDLNLIYGTYFYQVSAVNGGNTESQLSAATAEITLTDTKAPEVSGVLLTDAVTLTITFSEAVYGLDNLNNYQINNGITILQLNVNADNKAITLTTSEHSEGSYEISLANISDSAGNDLSSVIYSYSCKPVNISEGLEAYLKFNGNALDSTNNANDAAIYGGASFVNDPVRGEVIQLDGVDDYLSMGDKDLNLAENNTFTISLWFNADALGGSQVLIQKDRYMRPFLLECSSSTIRCGIRTSASSYMSSTSIENNTWYHLTYVYDGSNKILYINGVENIREATTGTLDSIYGDITIGSEPGSLQDFFSGMIDEMRIYNRALSAEEISVIYNNTDISEPAQDTTAPTVPQNLNGTAASDTQINLSWDASTDDTGIAGYRIYRGGVEIATTAETSYSDSGLTASTLYSYTVLGYDAAGNESGQSVSIDITTEVAPVIHYILSINTANGSITLNPDGGVYEAGTQVTVTPVAESGYAFHSWSGDVTGFDNPLTITMDSDKTITAVFNDIEAPGIPGGLTAAAVSTRKIYLRWQDNSDNERGFIIERKTGSSEFEEYTSVGKDTTKFLDTDLEVGETYTYRIRSYTRDNVSSACSDEVSIAAAFDLTQCHYIRADAPQGGDGSNWANAWQSLPNTLERDHTYYIADGLYGSYEINDPIADDTYIFIKKATIADHGTDTGWDNSYGDGEAFFQTTDKSILKISTGYVDIDGQEGAGTQGYGFHFQSLGKVSYTIDIYDPTWSYNTLNCINFRHSNIEHRGPEPFINDGEFTVAGYDLLEVQDASIYRDGSIVKLSTTGTMPNGLIQGEGYDGQEYYVRNPDTANNTIKLAPFNDPQNIVTGLTAGTGTHSIYQRKGGRGIQVHSMTALAHSFIQSCYIHDIPGINIYFSNTSHSNIVEYCHVARNHSDPVSHGEAIQTTPGENNCTNMIIRYSVWEDIEGSSIIVGKYNWDVYGNTFFYTTNYPNPGQHGSYTGMGSFWALSGNSYFHNTVYGLESDHHSIVYFGGADNLVYNNIWSSCGPPSRMENTTYDYNLYHDMSASNDYLAELSVEEPHSIIGESDPFVDSLKYNLVLEEEVGPGMTMPFPYNRDMYGNVRGEDGVFSMGAIEYDSSEPAVNTYTLTVDAANGSVNLNPAGGVYEAGTQVTVTPAADRGYAFDSWSGDISGSDNPLTITMDADKTITANFIQDQVFTPINEWRVLPIRNEAEFNAGLTGGEAEQHPHSIARCLSNPDIIYISHDCAGVWRSIDAGDSWQHTLDRNLWVNNGQSIEVDPVNPNIVFVVVDNSYNYLAPSEEGLYRSLDAGDTWERVLQTDTNYDPDIHRRNRHNIAYDLSSVSNGQANVWYVVFPDNAIFRSDDCGQTFVECASLSGHTISYGVFPHPTDGQTVYIASSEGLFISLDRGEAFNPIGNLPAGEVTSVAIDPRNPRHIYTVVSGSGLYESMNGGESFSLLRSHDASYVFMNPGYPDTLYVSGLSSDINTIVTHDAGLTWIEDVQNLNLIGNPINLNNWKGLISGVITGISPNPNDPNEAMAFSRASLWKTIDGGHTFQDSSTLFTGFAWSWWNDGIAFDQFNADRFATFNCDVGTAITFNGGDYFDVRNDEAYGWKSQGLIGWYGTYAGDFQPIEGSNRMVAAIGGYFKTQLMYSDDAGENWTLLTTAQDVNNTVDMHLFIAYHPDDPNVVYAGDKISTDGGQSFTHIDFGIFADRNPYVIDICRVQADTVYAIAANGRSILRSDDRCATWVEYGAMSWSVRPFDSLPTFAADPQDSDKIYTVYSSGDLASFDGTDWTTLGVLPLITDYPASNFIRSVAIDPNHPKVIYVSSFGGGASRTFRSVDGGENWEDIQFNLPLPSGSAMKVNPHSGELFKGSSIGTWVLPAPYESTHPIYDKCTAVETLQNPLPFFAPPSALTAFIVSGSQVDLSWIDNSSSEDGFRILRSEDGDTFAEISTIGADTTSYSDTTVGNNAAYYYRVQAYRDNLNSGYLATAKVIMDEVPPTEPRNLQVESLSDISIRLNWQASVDANSVNYCIYRDGVLIANTAELEFIDTGLTPDTNYSYKIEASDDAGNKSAQTAPVTASTDPINIIFSDVLPVDQAEVIAPVNISAAVSSPHGIESVSLWSDMSGTWQKDLEITNVGVLSPSVLTNSDFESFSNGRADAWTMVSDSTIEYALSVDQGYEGEAQRIDVTAPGGWGFFYYQDVQSVCEVGESYIISLWYKTSGADGMHIAVANAPHSQVAFQRDLGGTNGEWHRIEYTFTYNNNDATMIRFGTNTIGSYWVDNYELRKLVPDQTAVSFEVNPVDGAYTWALEAVTSAGILMSDVQNITFGNPILPNHAPLLAQISDQVVDEGSSLSLTFTATDEDDDSLTYSAEGLPERAEFVDNGDNSATFRWMTDYAQAGDYTFTVYASDGSETAQQEITITVNNVRIVKGSAPDVDMVVLENLYKNEKRSESVKNGEYIIANVPQGVYGLVLYNTAELKAAYDKRISITDDSSDVIIEPVSIGTETGSLDIGIAPELPDVRGNISLCKDLGNGLAVELANIWFNDAADRTLISGIASGNYILKVHHTNGYECKIIPVKIKNGDTLVCDIALTPGYRVYGNFENSHMERELVKVINDKGYVYSTFTEADSSYELYLPAGEYELRAYSGQSITPPVSFSLNESNPEFLQTPVTSHLIDTSVSGTITGADTLLGADQSLKVTSPEGIHSVEYGIDATSWEALATSNMIVNPELYILTDDTDRGIHSRNKIDASRADNDFTINSSGFSLNGQVTVDELPAVKPIVKLYDSSNQFIGICEGSMNGEYCFASVPSGSNYHLEASSESGEILTSDYFDLSGDMIIDLDNTAEIIINSYNTLVCAGGALRADVTLKNINFDDFYLYAEVRNSVVVGSKVIDTDPQGTIVVPVDIYAAYQDNYRLKITAVERSGGWSSPDTFAVNSDSNISIVPGGVPEIMLTDYTTDLMAGETLTATLEFQYLNDDTHFLYLELKGPSGNAAYLKIDNFNSSEAAYQVSLTVAGDTLPGDYRMKVSYVSRTEGWSSIDNLSYNTAADIVITENINSFVRIEDYDFSVMAGETLNFTASWQNLDEAGYHIYVELKGPNGMSGGSMWIDEFNSNEENIFLSIPVRVGAVGYNRYRLKMSVVSRTNGWSDVAAVSNSLSNITLSPRLEIDDYAKELTAGDIFTADLSWTGFNSIDYFMYAELKNSTSGTVTGMSCTEFPIDASNYQIAIPTENVPSGTYRLKISFVNSANGWDGSQVSQNSLTDIEVE